MPHRRSTMYAMFIAAFALAASNTVSAQQKGGKHHTLAATLAGAGCDEIFYNIPLN